MVNKSGRIFLRSTGLLYKFLPTNLGVCKPTFYNFYTSHLRWNSTISDHTDLGQNAVFHNFWRQITLSQYSGRSIVGFKRNCSKIFQNYQIGPAGSHFYSASCPCGRVFEWTLEELRFHIRTNLLLLFFCYLMVSVIKMCNLMKRLIRATIWVLLQAMFMNDENKRQRQAIKIARETTNNQ